MDLRSIVLHVVAICVVTAFFLNPLQSFWHSTDEWIFLCLNSSTVNHPIQQVFWALANTWITDGITAVFLFGVFILYIAEAEQEKRTQRIAEFFYTGVWMGVTIVACKLCLSPLLEVTGVARESPSSVYDNCNLLSAAVPWIKIKDMAFNCFPADHAIVVFQWCAFFWFFAGLRRGLFTTVIALCSLIPRLIAGAHWFSDIAVGSIAVVAVSIAWGLFSPLLERGLHMAYKALRLICKATKAMALDD
jgi:membrane-associated phospholipid phosphatase